MNRNNRLIISCPYVYQKPQPKGRAWVHLFFLVFLLRRSYAFVLQLLLYVLLFYPRLLAE